MPKKRHTAEQIVTKLRQIDVLVAQGRTIGQACKEAEITEQSYYRWRNEYGGLEIEQAKRFKELERENARLKRLVADLSLEKQMTSLRETCSARSTPAGGRGDPTEVPPVGTPCLSDRQPAARNTALRPDSPG
jgi:putative transposase